MNQDIIARAIDYVKDVFAGDASGHDYFHTLRVYKMAIRLAQEEGADEQIVALAALAALLHDVDDRKLSPETARGKDRARAFLREQDVAEEELRAIVGAIDEVSYAGTDSVKPSTIEGACVQDADRLDALGAIGIARTFAYGGSHNRALYDPDEAPVPDMSGEEYRNHISSSLNHFYEKLFNLVPLLNTRSARKIGSTREAYMKGFVDRFLAEWDGMR
ncbi:HD domain-containing protein [Lancefieldella rimae]|uniref:HD domain-containing protein n=1 Tax=Lancefieldella rimae TaxID=1383 RepID=UPI0028807B1B|nr:HD domain-containing protein [Lancefieldella rimae]